VINAPSELPTLIGKGINGAGTGQPGGPGGGWSAVAQRWSGAPGQSVGPVGSVCGARR
jgi:hypothetical protein